jgi:PAS domain S-box-containing protein
MTVFAIISLVAFMLCFFLGNFIYHKNSKSHLNKMVAVLCILVGFLAFVEFEYRQAYSFQNAYYWLKISTLWPFVPAILLNISFIFTNKTKILKNKLSYLLIYVPALIISTLGLATNWLIDGAISEYWGWTYTFPQDPVLFEIMSIWTLICVLLAGYICISYYLMSKKSKKQQSKYLIAGLYVPMFISLFSDIVLPNMSIKVPEMTMAMSTAGIALISYGIWKYRFPALTPAVAADNIVSTMSNFFFLLDENMHIININQATKDLLGYGDSELIGKPLNIVFSEDEKSLFKENKLNASKKSITNVETTFKTKNSQLIPVFLSISLIESDNSQILGIVCIGNDITDIKLAENKIKASLEEKNLLLQEIHHRVKNNLQIISSLLSLQSKYVKDEEDLELFKESQSRVRSMAFIHEQLYQSSNFTNIDFSVYVENLISYLFHSYSIDPSYVNFKLNIDNVSLDINTAIPCGLIINEIVTNSLKYAFPIMEYCNSSNTAIISSEISNEICIRLHSYKENKFSLFVSDNGIGLPENVDFRNTDTLGLQLVNSLVDQLDGTIELDRINGTTFKIIFNKLNYRKI